MDRTTRSARPVLSIPVPPRFDTTVGVEKEYLTPPIWVASNPPPMFDRTEMKRTVSETSSWGSFDEDKEEETTTSSLETHNKENVIMAEIVNPWGVECLLVASSTGTIA
jgi:hypothetical protein